MTRADLVTINQALQQAARKANELAETGDDELVKLAQQIAQARFTLWHISRANAR